MIEMIKTIKQYALNTLLLIAPLQLGAEINNKSYLNKYNIKDKTEQKYSSEPISVKIGVGTKYSASKQDVEKSLDSLARDNNTILEDAWMFHNNILTDIGIYEKKSNVNLYEVPIYQTIYETPHGDTITLYHIHPNAHNKKTYSPPSITDIINHAILKPKFEDQKITLIEKVFDGKGMWELDLSKEVVEKINKSRESQSQEYSYLDLMINKNNTIWYITGLIQNNLFEKFDNTDTNNSSTIKKYINSMNDVGVKLKFTPTKENMKK
jgi:hypothetical protein